MRTRFEILFIIAALILAWCLFDAWHKLEVAERHIKAQQECIDHIPSPMEIQQQLIANGYSCGTDGADGFVCGPNSMAAWNAAVCNQYYELSVARMPKEQSDE